MAKKKRKLLLTERQVRFARAFLHAIHANESNGYLILAVVAWLKLDKDVQHFYHFGSYTAGAQALARVLLYNPRRRQKGYRAVVAALRGSRKDQKNEKGKVIAGSGNALQARDFLTALAMSKFERSHYGSADGNELTNLLMKKWYHLTGGAPIPDAWFIDYVKTKQPAKAAKEPPRQPRSLVHVLPKPDYLQPYAARIFYEERPHENTFVLPQERW